MLCHAAMLRMPLTLTRRLACVCTILSPHSCLLHLLLHSLQHNRLDDDAKRLLQDANRKRSTPAILEL